MTGDQVNTMLRNISGQTLSGDWVRNRASFHQYEGLDVTFVRRHWSKLKSDNGWSDTMFAEKIREVCIVGFVFGNVTENNFHKRSNNSQTSVNALISECRLVQHVSSANKRTGVTVGRTMIAFATEAVSIALFLGRDFTEGPATQLLTSLPSYMKTTVFLSVCPTFPTTKVGVFLCRVFTIWSANMSLVINRKGATRRKRNFTDQEFSESYQSQYVFSDISYASNAFEGNRAKAFLVSQGFGGAPVYQSLSAVYEAEKTRLGLVDNDVSEAEWIAAWA
jgi:hypothetical protein